jgi:eukaryotic-like serine/threonine-protein kinase
VVSVSIELLRAAHEYQITRLIAHGGMGSVYEARQSGAAGFAKTVAIKTIRRQLAADTEFTRLFIAEAKLVADLVHENIVQVYSLNLSEEGYFIVLEYVEGINLEQFLRAHLSSGWPLPVELGAFIASRVCRGLEYAHRRRGPDGRELGIVHRDISPKNTATSRPRTCS